MNRIFHYFCVSSLMGSALIAVEIESDAIQIFPASFGKPDALRVKKLLAQKGVQQQLMVMVGGISDSEKDTVFFLDMNGMQTVPPDEKEHAFVYGYEDTASLALSGCLNRYSLMTDSVFRREGNKHIDAFLGLENLSRSPELREAWYRLSQKKNFAGKRLFWAIDRQIQLFKEISLEDWIEENPDANPADFYNFTIPEMAAFRQQMEKNFNLAQREPEENTIENWRNLYRDLFFATMLTLPEHERLNFKESYNFFSAEKPTTFAEAYLPFFNMMVSWRFHRISKVIQDHYRNAQRYHVPFYVMVEEPYVNILRKQLAAEELSNNVVDYRTIIKAWGTQQEKDLLEAPRFPQQKPATNNMGNTMSSYQRTITMKDLANEKPTHEIKSTSATEVMQAMHKMQSSESDASTQENADLAITQEIPIIDNDLEDADTTQNAQAQPISEAKTSDTYNANEDEEEYDNADAHGDISKTQNIQQPIIQKTTTPSTTTKAPEPTATPAQQTPTKSETVLNVTQNNNSTPTNSAPINTTETMISGGASAVEKKTRFTVKSTSVPAPKTSTTSSTNPTVTATPTTTTTPTSTQPQTTSKAVSAVTKSSNNLSEPTTAITEIQASGSSTAVEQKTTIAAKPLPQPQTKTTATLPNTAQTTVAASATSAKHVQQEAKTSVTKKTAQPLPQTNASVTAQQQPSTQKPDESTTTTTPKVESKQVAVVTSKTTFKPEVKTTTQATTDPTTTIKEQSKSTSVAPETSSELKTKPQASPISASSNTAPDSKKTAPNPDESKTSKATANESIDAVALAQLGETAESFQELINYKDEDAELSTNPSEKPEGWWFDFSDEHNASKEHSSYAEHMKTSPSRPKNPADNEPAKPQSINEVTPKTHAPKNAAWERMSDTPDTTNAESGDDAQPQESSAYESTQSRQKTKSTASPESVITYGADPKAASHSWIESDSSNDSDDEKEEETPPANAPTLQRHYSPRENQDFDVSITYAQDSTSTEDLIPSSPEETEEMKAEKLGEDIATFNRVSENTDDSSDFDNVLLSLGSDDEVTTFARDPNDISYVNCNDEEQATMETMLIDTATQTTSKPARTTLRNRS